jgi:hypothetical protein
MTIFKQELRIFEFYIQQIGNLSVLFHVWNRGSKLKVSFVHNPLESCEKFSLWYVGGFQYQYVWGLDSSEF